MPTWGSSRGPLDVVRLDVQRAGWQMGGLSTLTTAGGTHIKLTTTSPGALRLLLTDEAQDARLARAGEQLYGSCIAVDLAAIKSSRAAMHYEARLLATAAVWTPARLADVGYITSAQCQFCGERDTVFHRLWQCPEVYAARLEATSSRIIHNVIREAYENGAELECHEIHVAATPALVPKPDAPQLSTSDDFRLKHTRTEYGWSKARQDLHST